MAFGYKGVQLDRNLSILNYQIEPTYLNSSKLVTQDTWTGTSFSVQNELTNNSNPWGDLVYNKLLYDQVLSKLIWNFWLIFSLGLAGINLIQHSFSKIAHKLIHEQNGIFDSWPKGFAHFFLGNS